MQIQIIATSVETKPTAKGSYQLLEVTYKNLTYQGKTESKKVMSFGANATAFKALADAQPGSVWEVTVVKNSQGYNDWTAVAPSHASAAAQPSPAKSTPATRSSYETPEERAQRQVYIIRQSSIASAVNILGAGAKAPLKVAEVLDVAKQLENYVMDIKDPGPSGFEDIPDFDVPEVE